MIDEKRLRDCSYYLALALNPVDGSEEINLDGAKINLEQFLPLIFKHLNKIILKYPEQSEELLLYLVDAIHYSLCLSDDRPDVILMTEEQKRLQMHGHDEPKFRVEK